MNPIIGASLISATASSAGGIFGAVGRKRDREQNKLIADQNLQWQQKYAGMQMSREDNAMQRRVADLKAAGLSPTLAAGSPASAAQVVTPQSGMKYTDSPMERAGTAISGALGKASLAMTTLKAKKDIAQTEAQTELINKQKETAAYNLLKAKKTGVATNQALPKGVKYIEYGQSIMNQATKELKGKVKGWTQAGKKVHPQSGHPVNSRAHQIWQNEQFKKLNKRKK